MTFSVFFFQCRKLVFSFLLVPSYRNRNLKNAGLQPDLLTIAEELLEIFKIWASGLDILISGETEWCGDEEKRLCGVFA